MTIFIDWTMFSLLANLVFPHKCPVCDALTGSRRGFCFPCEGKIKTMAGPRCPQCGVPMGSSDGVGVPHPCTPCLSEPPHFDAHRSLFLYEDPLSLWVHRIKYGARFDGLRFLGTMMAERSPLLFQGADFLVPVPLSMKRLRSRMFNQSLELARFLGEATGIAVLPHSLKKVRDTLVQTKLEREERRRNLAGAFAWRDPKVDLQGKKVVLMDDVFTTGSTLSECAKVLKKEGAREVGALTVAHNLLKK